MKNILIILVASIAIVAFACKPKTETPISNSEASIYACPMKCEGDKTYSEPGKCPVCGMDLEPVSGAAASVAYQMNLAFMPEYPESGKPTRLTFNPKIKGNESAQVPLDEVHEKKIHIIIVSKDLGWYDHIHPEYQADGSYIVEETFPGGGDYILFADYHPTNAGAQVERKTITVTGIPKKAETFSSQTLTTQTNGYKVTLKPEGGKFLTNNMNHLGVEVTEKGVPITNFENVMGAKGHLVIISGDGQKYLHVHPNEVNGQLDLHTEFEQPGIHRAFFQFQMNGKLHTSYFTLDVKEGQPGELDTPEGHHEHEGHNHDHEHENQN